MGSVFVGRETELGVLGVALADAASARPRAMVVEGTAGVGKTALLRRFVTALAETTVLWASGEEIESSLAYGVLDQLRAEAGAPPAAHVADPLAAGASFLELLGERQDAGPVVLVVDDAHWADTPSLHALIFALRRLRVDRVLAVLTVRPEEAWRLPASMGRLADAGGAGRVRLGGLSAAELARLAWALGMGAVAPAAARRLEQHTGGNPLYATALLEELDPEVLRRPGPHPLPAPRSFRAVVLDRLASCSPATQRLVEAGAVLGGRWPIAVAARLAGLDDPLPAVEEALGANLIAPGDDVSDGAAAFCHPLVQSAVYHGLGRARRAALHRQAAEAVGDQGAALRHRAAAALGPDPALAGDLESFARAQAARSAWAAAADATLAAARLTPAGTEEERLVTDAFHFLVAAGDLAQAFALADEAETWDESARRYYVLALRAGFTAGLSQCGPLLMKAWTACDPVAEPVLASRIAVWSGVCSLGRANEDAVGWARTALRCSPGAADETAWWPRLVLQLGLGTVGRAPEGLHLAASLPDPLPEPGPRDVDLLLGRGVLRLWSDELPGAVRDLEAVARACRRRGPVVFAIVGLFYLADARYRLGDWDEAVVHADLAVSTMSDTGWMPASAFTHAAAAFALAARGDLDNARGHSRAAVGAARAMDDLTQLLWAATAEARVGQAAGDPQAQATACTPLLALAGRDVLEEPGIQPWRELYAEALVRLGRLDEAEAVLQPLEARAAERALASAQAGAARVRGLLESARGHARAARDAFEASLGHLAQVDMPFARAQAELAYGAFLRRQGRRRAALAHLEVARAILARLEARPFLERCEQELAACGLARARRAHETVPYLTPQELSVVHLVCTGLTNREVAAELMLSVKTVEYHLGNVFAKLGVRSRTRLVARMAGGGGAGGGGQS